MLNPIFYGLSSGIGVAAGLVSDRVGLGFVTVTEGRVCKHLNEHLAQIPQGDRKPRAIPGQMRIDEEQHSSNVPAAGGLCFPALVKPGMSLLTKVVTKSTYRI